ncbi:MAG TPA: endolytic transglycosylase MltG [Firmicutes bacterium]|jgi:UPF0755 protein|nr:endolytic transglycosylase MltG [Bacillota bacterium]
MENTDKVPAEKKKRPALKIALIVFVILFIAAAGAACYGWTWLQNQLSPAGDSDRPILITVPKGATSAGVGNILYEAGLIRNSIVFRFWLRHYELDGKIQAGDYILSESLSLSEIADKLVKGDVHRDTIRFTIPEGLFLEDIAARLADKGIVDKERFLELAADLSLWQDYWFVREMPEGLEVPLEGYLFPNTYEILGKAENREELIIAIMLRQFDKVFTEEMRSGAEALGISVHEAVTLASIVEKEAVSGKERPLIAGVFFNRLGIKMPLQSCATVNYILKDFSIRDISPYKKDPSPYNTYLYGGLPPGPIAGPGRAALEAVIWPEESDYLYFVAKDDGSDEHYFAKTYAEHIKNARKAKANRNN